MIRYKTYLPVNMNKFKFINWNPSVENLIDDVFIKDERMQNDSAMYKIMNGTFNDPFDDIEHDYSEVNIPMLMRFNKDISNLNEKKDETEDEKFKIKEEEDKKKQYKQNTKKLQESKKKQGINNKKFYIPGMKNDQPFYFPRKSSLNSDQQAMCTRVLRLLNNQIIPTSAEEKTEFEHYMALQKTISAEQSEFLKFVKKMWDENASWDIKHNEYIESKWSKQLFELKQLPRYYVESSNVPFSSDKNIIVKFVSYLEQGTLSKVVMPKLDKSYFLKANSTTLFRKYPLCLSPSLSSFKLPVSKDTYCMNFAEMAKVDLVISSSGLKCILNNIGSDYSNSWTISVIIKSHNGKNVIYIDKKLPPVAATVSQKNTWVYKYVLRHCLIPTEVELSEGETSTEKDIAEAYEKSEEMFNPLESDRTNPENNPSSTNLEQNVTYKLFTIGPPESDGHCKLIKDIPKEYQILVRTKTDCVEELPNGQLQPLMLAPKLEHQLTFGAEAATLEEGLQQWMSLLFRPNTLLARVRIAAESAEVIQTERHTVMSLSAEMKRLHKVKVEDSLTILHNVIERLSYLMPGQYIMRHTLQHGPFAYIYKKVEECGKNSFDLHSVYESQTFKTIPVTPWPPIDTMLMTPTLKYLNKMPAMFDPCKIKTIKSSNMTPGTSGVEQHITKNQNISKKTVPVRRSQREKKPSRKLTDT